MERHDEYEAAEQIRRLISDDERFSGVSGATAFRRADQKYGWPDAGFFSFERNGHLYFVTVDRVPTDTRTTAAGADREVTG